MLQLKEECQMLMGSQLLGQISAHYSMKLNLRMERQIGIWQTLLQRICIQTWIQKGINMQWSKRLLVISTMRRPYKIVTQTNNEVRGQRSDGGSLLNAMMDRCNVLACEI
jgi:hypothetical protein